MAMDTTTQALADNYANQYHIPAPIFSSLINQESGGHQFDANGNVIRGTSGEYGIMQLMPNTASALGVTDPTDLNQNLKGGATLLNQLYNHFGDWTKTLEAYNAGQPKVDAGNVPSQSVAYANTILTNAGYPTTTSTPLSVTGQPLNNDPAGAGFGTDKPQPGASYTDANGTTIAGTAIGDQGHGSSASVSGGPGKDTSFFGLDLKNVGLFTVGMVVLAVGLAVSVMTTKAGQGALKVAAL